MFVELWYRRIDKRGYELSLLLGTSTLRCLDRLFDLTRVKRQPEVNIQKFLGHH